MFLFKAHLTTVKSGLGQDHLIKISVPVCVKQKVLPFFKTFHASMIKLF